MEILPESLIIGAILLVIICAGGWLVLGRYRPVFRRLLAFANTLLLSGAVLFLLTAFYQLLSQLHRSDEYEYYVVLNRMTGPYWLAYWGPIIGKGVLPQLLWLSRLRRSIGVTIALVPWLLIDYWLPLVYSHLHRDYLPTSWAMIQPDYRGLAVVSAGYLVLLSAGWIIARRQRS